MCLTGMRLHSVMIDWSNVMTFGAVWLATDNADAQAGPARDSSLGEEHHRSRCRRHRAGRRYVTSHHCYAAACRLYDTISQSINQSKHIYIAPHEAHDNA